MRKKLFQLAVFAGLFMRGCLLQPALAQNPDLSLNSGSNYVEVGRGIPWGTSFNRTYLLVPNSPNASLCIYVVNNNPTSTHSFTTAVFQSADSQVPDFTNNQGRFTGVPLANMPQAIGPLLMGSGFTQATAAAKVAVRFSNASTQSGSPDTADVFFVQTTSGTCGSASLGIGIQGIVTQQQSAATVLPLINGSLQPTLNANFNAVGVDNFNLTQSNIPGALGTYTIGTVPTPTVSGEVALSFDANFADLGSGTVILAPWVCQPVQGNSACTSNGPPALATLNGAQTGQTMRRFYSNPGGGGTELNAIVLSSASGTTWRQGTTGTTSVAFTSNTLAGSLLISALRCGTACTINSVTDTQGNSWVPIVSATRGAGQQSGLYVYVSQQLSTAAADTITWTVGSGTSAGMMISEFTGVTPAQLVALAISNAADQIGNQVERLDAVGINQFSCSVTLSTNTTTQCQPPPTTIAGVPARLYITDFQINTTVAGTATTLQLKTGTGASCAGATANLSAILYPNTTVGIQNILGTRTPLVAPIQSAVCVTQAGTTAGTSLVEIRGFLAP